MDMNKHEMDRRDAHNNNSDFFIWIIIPPN